MGKVFAATCTAYRLLVILDVLAIRAVLQK